MTLADALVGLRRGVSCMHPIDRQYCAHFDKALVVVCLCGKVALGAGGGWQKKGGRKWVKLNIQSLGSKHPNPWDPTGPVLSRGWRFSKAAEDVTTAPTTHDPPSQDIAK